MSLLKVDENFIDDFLSEFQIRSVSKNRPLLYQGEVPPMAFYIKQGIVKIYNITSQGEEKVVGYESRGGLFPVEWLFSHTSVSMYYYDTFTDCELVRVQKDELIEKLNSNEPASRAFLSRYVSMYIGATMQVHALEQSKVRQKLLSLMQYLTLRFGADAKGSLQKIELRLTHQEIANLMGASRETTSTEIGKLTKEGVLKVEDLQYTVDVDKVLRLLGEEDFKEISL